MSRSIEIKVRCDMCNEVTEDQTQTTLRLDRKEVLLDLCTPHKAELADAVADFLSNGVRQRKQPVAATPAVAALMGERELCRICQRSFADRESIRKHVSRAHGMPLSEYDAGAMPPAKDQAQVPPVTAERPHECPECGGGYQNPQGLAAHRRIAHGVAGKSARQSA